MEKIRLNKYIASLGYCSRRKADEFIFAGKVKLNGKIVDEMGVKVSEEDKIEVGGEQINKKNQEKIYLALNKPLDYISSTTSKQGKCIMDLIPEKYGRLFPIGRLDKNSRGLIVLTNDGELANILMHPSFEHEKEYVVKVNKKLDDKDLEKLVQGISVDGVKMKTFKINYLEEKKYKVILREGKKRQIRLMFWELGYQVLDLERIRINKLELKKLPLGKFVEVKKSDIL